MDTLQETGWDSDSDGTADVDERTAAGTAAAATAEGEQQEDGAKEHEEEQEEEEDISDPRGLLPRDCEVRAQREAAAAAAAAAAGAGGDAGAAAAGVAAAERRRLLGVGVAEQNAPRGPVDRAFYAWVRGAAPVATLAALFGELPAGRRVCAHGRADGTFRVGLRVVHMRLRAHSGGDDGCAVGVRVGAADVALPAALDRICRVEQVRLRGLAAAALVL